MAAVLKLLRRRNRKSASSTAISLNTSPKHEFVGHTDYIWSFVFLQDNVHIVSGSDDGTMRKWDCETGLLVGETWKVDDGVCSLALSPDGEMIACGRRDGSVQRWDTNGQKLEGIWTGHSEAVWSLSWSPSGHHLASGSGDGTILIRKAEGGEVEVGPITANQGLVQSVAYSPSGDKIASGGGNISVWDSHTGELLVRVGLIEVSVYSIVWSLDGSKVYCASKVARVLDSTSGTELHHFQLDNLLFSFALSPAHNLLAGVGQNGIVQLWDAESYQPLGQPFHQEDGEYFVWVSFSPNGRYLAFGGDNKKITLRTVNDSAPELPALAANHWDGLQQEAMPESQLSYYPSVNAINPLAQSAVNENEVLNDPYQSNFFTSSHSPFTSPSPNPSHKRHWRHALSLRHDQLTKEPGRLTTRLFSRRALPKSPLHAPTHSDQTEPTPKGKSRAGNHEGEHDDMNHSEDVALGTAECGHEKGQREQPIPPTQTSTSDDPSSPAELDSRENRALWKSIFRARKKGRKEAPAEVLAWDLSPPVVEVYARRVPQGYAVLTPKQKKSAAGMTNTSTAPGGSSEATAANPGGSSEATAVNPTYDDADSDWRIEGRWNTFLDRICYPCGH